MLETYFRIALLAAIYKWLYALKRFYYFDETLLIVVLRSFHRYLRPIARSRRAQCLPIYTLASFDAINAYSHVLYRSSHAR